MKNALELGVQRLSGFDSLGALNADAKADGFYVVPGFLYIKEVLKPTATELAEARRAGYVPATDDFLVSVYSVRGEGYVDEGVALWWVKDAGEWRLFTMKAFD